MCGESPQEAPLCGTGRHGFAVGNAPPIFFLRHQKENAPCTVEKKKCLFQPFTYVQGWGNVFCGNFYAGEGVHTKSRAGCGKSLIRYAVLMEHQISGCK